MKRVLVTTAVAALLGAGTFVALAASKSGTEALMKADAAFSAATQARGMDGFLGFIADEVATLRPNLPIISGKKDFSDQWATLLNDPMRKIRWRPLLATISDSGDLGYTVGSYVITKVEEGASPVVASGKYVTIWKKQADGSWKVVFDAGVQDALPGAVKKP